MAPVEAGERLPIFQSKTEILEAVNENKTVIFVGETASGKSTQLPQFLLEWGYGENKCIAITQPRQVAAVTVAERVAHELGTELGGKVGYSVRFRNVTSPDTKIKYVTDGMLLREAVSDRLLSDYSVVILDEAHERTLCNDVLFGIVKSAQKQREDEKQLPLKVIVTSATLDYKHLSEYFDSAPVLFIAGRKFSVQIINAIKEHKDYIHAALAAVFQIHQNEGEGDILVFCTGQEEIESMISEVQKTPSSLSAGNLQLIPCGLYAALPVDHQTEVFKSQPNGVRKVIFSTNIAETSVTVPGIKYVVDTGMVKAKSYNPVSGYDILSIQRISKAQADQRSGRAGRESNGICYRLYTTEEQEKFKDYAVPEILRCCLSNVFLQMIAGGIDNIHGFDFIDKPPDENIHVAIKQLKLLDAIVENDGKLELTEYGKKMVLFPLNPKFSKAIIASKKYRCTDEILTIVSLFSVESIFYSAPSERGRFNRARKKFEVVDGDHIMLLNVYEAYRKVKGNQRWCRENFINSQNVKKAISVRRQLSQICERIDIEPCSCQDTEKISKCLASGLFMNTAVLQDMEIKHGKECTFKTIEGKQEVNIHPTSCVFKQQSSSFCYIYTELVQTSKIYMRNVMRISANFLEEVAPSYFKDKQLPWSHFKV